MGNSSHDYPDPKSEGSYLENNTLLPAGMELAQFAEILPFGLYLYNLSSDEILYANECLELIAGVGPQDIQKGVRHAFYSRIHPQDIEYFLSYQKKSLEAGNSDYEGITYRLLGKDNQWFLCRSRFSVYHRDAKGACIEALATVEKDADVGPGLNASLPSGSLQDLVLSKIPESVYLFSPDGIIQYANDAGARYFGKEPFPIVGCNINKFKMGEESFRLFNEKLSGVIQTGESTLYRTELLGEEGIRYYEYSLAPVQDKEGKVLSVVWTVRDIGVRVTLENALKQKDEKFQSILNTMTDGVLIWNQNLDCVWINQTAQRHPLTSNVTQLPLNLMEIFNNHPYLREHWEKRLKDVFQTGKLVQSEDVMPVNGKKFWIVSSFLPVLGDSESVESAALIFRDVTDEKRRFVERRIKDMAIESASSGIALTDMNGTITYVNQAFKTMYGFDDRDVLDHSIFEYIISRRVAAAIRKTLQHKGRWDGEVETLRKDQQGIPIQLSVHLVKDEEKKPLCFMLTALDISGRKRYEDELHQYRNYLEQLVQERTHDLEEANNLLQKEILDKRKAEKAFHESESRFQGLIERAEDIVFVVRLDGIVTLVNPAIYKLTGWTRDEVMGHYFDDFICGEDYDRVMETIQDLTQFQLSPYIEVRVKCKDGTCLPMEVSGAVLGEPGEPNGVLGVCRSLTLRKDMENRLRESEKVARTLLNAFPDASFLVDIGGRLLAANQAFLETIKAWEGLILGLSIKEFCPQPLLKNMQNGIDVVVESGRLHQYDETYKQVHYQVIIYPITDEAGKVFQMALVMKDVTEYKRSEKALKEMSLVDDLTGLYNRRGFLTLAHQQIKITKRRHSSMTLLFADLDQMKWINDKYGHLEGDWALREISSILRQSFRESDVVGRIGGDEFVVLMPQTSIQDANTLLVRLEKNLKEFNSRGDAKYPLSISKGLAEFEPHSPCSMEDLIAKADQKMYDEKNRKSASRP